MHKDMPIAALRRCAKIHYGHIRLYNKKLIASRTNRNVMHRLRASYSIAPRSQYLLSEQIRSYYKKIDCQSDKSYRNAQIMCQLLLCAAVS